MTLMLKLDLDIVVAYLHAKNEANSSRSCGHTDRQTNTHMSRKSTPSTLRFVVIYSCSGSHTDVVVVGNNGDRLLLEHLIYFSIWNTK